MLPFTRDEFLAVFELYNQAIWPAQIIAYLIGIAAFILLFRKGGVAGRLISLSLGILWLWTGVFYHWGAFSQINVMAYLFGSIFVTQGASFLVYGTIQGRTKFAFRKDPAGLTGLAFIVYSALLYPLIGWLSGVSWPEMPMFGVTPCPLTIFTFGMMLFARPLFSRWILAIPLIWSLIGGSAAFLLGITQDWLLLFSGLLTFALFFLVPQGDAPQG